MIKYLMASIVATGLAAPVFQGSPQSEAASAMAGASGYRTSDNSWENFVAQEPNAPQYSQAPAGAPYQPNATDCQKWRNAYAYYCQGPQPSPYWQKGADGKIYRGNCEQVATTNVRAFRSWGQARRSSRGGMFGGFFRNGGLFRRMFRGGC